MLYDLRKDPDENTNIAGEPRNKENLSRMAVLLEQRKQEAGRVPKKRNP